MSPSQRETRKWSCVNQGFRSALFQLGTHVEADDVADVADEGGKVMEMYGR